VVKSSAFDLSLAFLKNPDFLTSAVIFILTKIFFSSNSSTAQEINHFVSFFF